MYVVLLRILYRKFPNITYLHLIRPKPDRLLGRIRDPSPAPRRPVPWPRPRCRVGHGLRQDSVDPRSPSWRYGSGPRSRPYNRHRDTGRSTGPRRTSRGNGVASHGILDPAPRVGKLARRRQHLSVTRQQIAVVGVEFEGTLAMGQPKSVSCGSVAFPRIVITPGHGDFD